VERKQSATITPELRGWLRSLAPEKANRVTAAIDRVSVGGPTQGRPLVDHIKGSRHHKMKEMRTGTVRVFFAFEGDRPIMLCGGDKRGAGKGWYQRMIGQADRLYDTYQRDDGKGGPGWRRDPPSHGR
jgi:hypothetical protein